MITALKQNRDVAVFFGDDVVAFRSLLPGVDGSMIIAPAVFPAAFQKVARVIQQGDSKTALRHFSEQILPFIHLFGAGDEISTTKALFKHLGILQCDELRPRSFPVCPSV
jgi:4-hydroxy-tetrahydrodipicolinate synthase